MTTNQIKPNAGFAEILSGILSEPGKIGRAYSAFHNYSIGNQLLAMWQCAERGIELGPINTYKGWQSLGRQVSKGSKALMLCMPVTFKKTDKETGEETTGRIFTFANKWFVLSQTEGEDYANEIKTPAWDSQTAVDALGFVQEPFAYMDGNCQGYAKHDGKTFAINPVAAFPHKTRFHELAHHVLGHTREAGMSDSETTPRDVREVEAESVAYILCTLLSLPGIEESRAYVQGWIAGETISEKSAQKIFSAADKILKAGQPKPVEA